jgi:gamma-glutamyl:cysteine ligase YbdK (ATP-grasp superfamily)
MRIGTEHEYSVNSPDFDPLPVSDRIIEEISGSVTGEIPFAGLTLCKELQKTVIEFVPATPAETVRDLEESILPGIDEFYRRFGDRYRLLGLGMHPLLRLEQTSVWDHDEQEYYAAYDRLFHIRQHGWLNIQALQINLEYSDESGLVDLFNRLRCLIPYLVAVTASSPLVEGKTTGFMDNRLVYYQENQRQIPLICNRIIPGKIGRLKDYLSVQEEIYAELKKREAGILCEEWVTSGGLIVRFSRPCIEIKALDEQECLRSDMAVCAFVRALLRYRSLDLDEDRECLIELTKEVTLKGTGAVRPELDVLYKKACLAATRDESRYLPLIGERIAGGSLAEQMRARLDRTGDIKGMLGELSESLRSNVPWNND